jgi:hypothetical protein
LALVDHLEPFWPDSTDDGVQQWPRNCAIAPGAMDSAPTASVDYKGALIYVPGTPDVLYTNLQSPTSGTYDLRRVATNRCRVLSADALDTAGALALTADMSGAIIDSDAATMAFTVPALTAANSGASGLFYHFIQTATATTVTLTTGAADLLHGGVQIMSTTAGAENDAFSADGSDDLIFTMNGTTKGGIIGSTWTIWAASATKWIITGNLIGSGTLVTPFS